MDTRTLGTNRLATSSIGLGCMGFSQGYGSAEDTSSVAAIRAAIDVGVQLIDTAMSYGQGHNEVLVGRAISGRRERVHVATKLGIVRDGEGVHLDGKPENVGRYCDDSLSRLGVDVIDLLYLHRADPQVPIVETVGAMADLVRAGKVRHLGVSEVTPTQLEQATTVHPLAAVQFEWSLMWREPEADLIPTARRLGVGLVPYSPLGRGLLTATLGAREVSSSPFRAADPRFNGRPLGQNLDQVHALASLAAALDLTAAQLALAWLLAQGDDVVPVPGSRRADRVVENAAAAAIHLTRGQLAQVDAAAPPLRWAGDRQSFAVPVLTRTRGAGEAPV